MSPGLATPSVLLPAHVAGMIRRIAAELRNMPRAAVTDRLELVHWLGRQARSLDAVAGSRMLEPAPMPPLPIAVQQPAPTPCSVCEARRRRSRRRGTMSDDQLALPFGNCERSRRVDEASANAQGRTSEAQRLTAVTAIGDGTKL